MNFFEETEFNMGGKPCFDKMNPYLITCLITIRTIVDAPHVVNSSYRDEEYNRSVNGSDTSQHLLGNAVDISTIGWTGKNKADFLRLALNMGLSVGIYDNFFHIDCRNTRPVIWVG